MCIDTNRLINIMASKTYIYIYIYIYEEGDELSVTVIVEVNGSYLNPGQLRANVWVLEK